MFNNSISVLSRAAARFKKIVLFAELIIQLMFVGYYTYLLVVHLNDLVLLIGYSILIALGVSIFVVMLFTLDPYQKKVLEFKKYIRRVLRVVSWTGKVIVIGYNIYCLIRFGMTETGHLLLVLSIIIFVTEVILFVASTILSYYYQLFIYALKMDYQHLIGNNEDISEKPIGRVLLNVNSSIDYEDEVNMLFIEQEIYEETKKYSEKEESLPINRRKVEKQILSFYKDTQFYYLDRDRLIELSEAINEIDIDKKSSSSLYVLKFFLVNALEQVYFGLNDQYFRFVLCALTLYLRTNSLPIVEIVYQIIIKSLVGNTEWNKPLAPIPSAKKSVFSLFKNKNNNTQTSLSITMFNAVDEIIKKSVEEKEQEMKRTIGGEIEGIVSTTIKKKVSGSIKSKIKGFFKKKKK